MADIARLLEDLAAEQTTLDTLVADLDEALWALPSAAAGWSVGDTIAHLAQFDDEARLALVDPSVFDDHVMASRDPQRGGSEGFQSRGLVHGRALGPSGTLAWWRDARQRLMGALHGADPATRVPWFAHPMSLASFTSARLMETWAHGLDIFDGLGVTPVETDRLAHVAFLACRARAYSYEVNDLPPPDGDVRVELDLPSGAPWVYGPEAGTGRIRGSASAFCRVATQRRHRDDVVLQVDGESATQWLAIAQAYAGPVGRGRQPGQFPVTP